MITEDYVSFETAKLLKEKGFDAECHSHYYPCHYPDGSIEYHKYGRTELLKKQPCYDIYSLKTLPKDHYLAPTIQMAMKWLREKHNKIIVPGISLDDQTSSTINHYIVGIWYVPKNNGGALCFISPTPENGYSTYEEACEAGIKYCLENLI